MLNQTRGRLGVSAASRGLPRPSQAPARAARGEGGDGGFEPFPTRRRRTRAPWGDGARRARLPKFAARLHAREAPAITRSWQSSRPTPSPPASPRAQPAPPRARGPTPRASGRCLRVWSGPSRRRRGDGTFRRDRCRALRRGGPSTARERRSGGDRREAGAGWWGSRCRVRSTGCVRASWGEHSAATVLRCTPHRRGRRPLGARCSATPLCVRPRDLG